MSDSNKQTTTTTGTDSESEHHPPIQMPDLQNQHVDNMNNISSARSVSCTDVVGRSTINSQQNSETLSKGEHPYKEEQDNFKPDLSSCIDIEPVKNLKQTPLIMIETKPQLEDLIKSLEAEKALGVDLEYSDHGYVPLTCTIQISTKSVDYIVDTINLKNDAKLLLPIFMNPKIVKVFHAGSNDLKWLQQDFKIFVLNFFDTQIAMKHLGEEKIALKAALAEKFNVQQDKSFQRADFRIRPLPDKYKEYARSDSHYLIGLYEIYRNDLMQQELLSKVWNECSECTKVLYGKDDPCSGVEQYIKGFHQRQLNVLRRLNEWRHATAKQYDKAPGMVLSKEALKNLTLQLPQDAGQILILAKSQFVKRDVSKIIKIMASAQHCKNSSGQVVQPDSGAVNPQKRQFNGGHNRRGRGHPYKRGRYEHFPRNFNNFNNQHNNNNLT